MGKWGLNRGGIGVILKECGDGRVQPHSSTK